MDPLEKLPVRLRGRLEVLRRATQQASAGHDAHDAHQHRGAVDGAALPLVGEHHARAVPGAADVGAAPRASPVPDHLRGV
eukprot:13354095-Alexandrium_andersonii.AAC.1